MKKNKTELTILMPCLNESETLLVCIQRAKKLLMDHGILGEILISDNGSTDGSLEIARREKARVINCETKGYGAALKAGIENAKGDYILMADSDDSYHFDEAFPLIEKVREGFDVCMGTRLKGKIVKGSMPWKNRYIGNPVLSFIGRFLFKIPVSDFHCGMRCFKKKKILELNLVTSGMEWASEMVIKSSLAGLRMTESPITLYKDGRSRAPHLRPWRDGLRHLQFMLLYSPKWLFLYPGVLFSLIGLIFFILIFLKPLKLFGISLDIHTMIISGFLFNFGIQMIFTGIFARVFAHINRILPDNEIYKNIVNNWSIEKVIAFSIILIIASLSFFMVVLVDWYLTGFKELIPKLTMRYMITSITLLFFSLQLLFNNFLISLMIYHHRPRKD